jgi:hypothetical protein
MADIPRDPRQLARDILAGKVRIEDLARERQMRAGGLPTPALRQPQAQVPASRQAPMPPPVRPAPLQRPAPRMPVQRPMMPQQARPVQRPMVVPVVRQVQRPLQVTIAPSPTTTPPQVVRPAVTPEPVAVAKAGPRPARIQELVKSKRALRQGILMAEILGKPIALREDTQGL